MSSDFDFDRRFEEARRQNEEMLKNLGKDWDESRRNFDTLREQSQREFDMRRNEKNQAYNSRVILVVIIMVVVTVLLCACGLIFGRNKKRRSRNQAHYSCKLT